MVGYIFAAIFMSLLWTAVVVLGLPLAIAIVPTAVVVLTIAAVLLVKKLKDRKAAQEIERALSAQGSAHVQSTRPDQQGEVQAMQEEFTKAVASLKSSKLARGGSDALSVLPWYLIIGPPGAGKSTALRNSGLQFPYLSARGGGVRGVGGTRNCEWWLTNEAVILDTAGRYTTEEDDKDEWFAFLDVVAKNRPKKPINGILVAVSVGELIGADEQQAARLGQTVRERVDEVMARLRLIVPVYVLFTKCDLVAGFVETFGDLHKSERSQMWGFTVPTGKVDGPGDLFRARFDELVDIIERRSLKRVAQERRQEARARIYQFPLQFGGLKANLAEFLQNLFVENVYADTPTMRGVYFTSGTQEGRPIDRIMSSIADAFGMPAVEPDGPVVEAKSYFLGELFSSVIFKDQSLAVRSTAETKRQKALRYAYAGGAIAIAAMMLCFPTLSFFQNRALAQSVHAAIQQARVEKGKSVDFTHLAKLTPLRERLELLLKYQEEGAPFGYGFGMYQGDGLIEAVRPYYVEQLKRTLVAPVFETDLDELETFVRDEGALGETEIGREQVKMFERLKLHLLLSRPKVEGEPLLDERRQQWAALQLTQRVANVLEEGDGSDLVQRIEEHARLYAKLSAQDDSLLFSRNETTAKRVRAALAKMPWSALALQQLIAEVPADDYDLSLRSILGTGAPQMKATKAVRGAFTKKGYDELVKARLDAPLENSDAWVLAEKGTVAQIAQGEIQRLRSAYYEQYIQEWRSFLESVRLEMPKNKAEALAMLEDLTRGKPPPFGRIFRAIAHNTRLEAGTVSDIASGMFEGLKGKLKGKAGKAIQVAGTLGDEAESDERGLSARSVEREFRGLVDFGAATRKSDSGDEPLSVDVYQEQLEFLRDALRADIESGGDKGPLMGKLATARIRVQQLISSAPSGWRPRLEALLSPPLLGADGAATNDAAGEATQKWCSAVVTTFEANLAKYYPFNPNGADAAIADVTEFFKPDAGVLWGFYSQQLKEDIVYLGSRHQFVKGVGRQSIYNENLLRYLDRSREITQALFQQGSPEPGTTFSVTIHPTPHVASISFTIDGTTIDYNNGPELKQTVRWPGNPKKAGAKLVVRSNKGVKEELEAAGDWGLFRLLERGTVTPGAGGRSFSATWRIRALDAEVTLDFEPNRREAPFFGTSGGERPELLHPFRGSTSRIPHAIGKASAGCNG